MIKKQQNWEVTLNEFIRVRRLQRFSITANDCVRFANRAVIAMCGVGITGPALTNYNSEEEANALTQEIFKGDLETAMESLFKETGLMEISVKRAVRGDLALFRLLGIKSVLLCNGEFALTPSKEGLQEVPMYMALRAWRIVE